MYEIARDPTKFYEDGAEADDEGADAAQPPRREEGGARGGARAQGAGTQPEEARRGHQEAGQAGPDERGQDHGQGPRAE